METNYQELVQNRAAEFFSIIEKRFKEEEVKQIETAYNLAKDAHAGQKRKNGEPYIVHPIAVAHIVAVDMNLDANPVIAALLHDVVEDTDYTIEDIKEMFGEDVSFLVATVTKHKKAHYEMSKQLDNFKQMLESVHYDIRAILIKLADRLHNMRTLLYMRPDKQMKIAGETDYFYAPLANRLGLYDIKTELENLSFRYRCPKDYNDIENKMLRYRMNNKDQINAFTDKIMEEFLHQKVNAQIEVKYRTPYSIWRKMKATGNDFYHLSFRHFIHIIFPDNVGISEKDMCLKIYSVLTDLFKEKPGSIDNLIDSPKENGYQGFHLKLLSKFGGWEEIHISSQRMLRNSKLGCVADRTEDNISNWIEKLKNVLQDMAYHHQDKGYIDSVLTSLYPDDIMVYTPTGNAIILPKGASALDFAFEIHSNIGEHAHYARINGNLKSIKTKLHRGDCVEIGINYDSEPKEDWYDCVMTYKAKRFLKSYFGHKTKPAFHRCKFCNPLPGDELIGFKGEDGSISIHKRDCRLAISRASKDGDSIISINFEEDEKTLYPVNIEVLAINRYHLLSDLIECITNTLKLPIADLKTMSEDNIATCTISFYVRSAKEFQQAIASINAIDNVDQVTVIDTQSE